MEVKQKRSLIRKFNKTKDVSIYSELLDLDHGDRAKCRCCGGEIIYPYTKIHCSDDGTIDIVDGCYKTIKTINENTYHLDICWDCLCSKFPNIKNPARVFNVMSEITAYAFNIPDSDFEKSRSGYAMTKQHMIEKYGEEIGGQKWDAYCKRQAETNTFEYKQKTFGWSKEEFDEYNSSRAATLKNFIKRYGDEIGRQKWDTYCKHQVKTKSWDYMVKTHGESKAREIIRQRLSGITDSGYSKVSQELFRKLDKKLCKKYTTHFATKDFEVERHVGNLIYKLDYFVEELNVCVEFNGSIFHADPRLFEDETYPNPFNKNLSAKDIREHDDFRYKTLKNVFGIKTIVVWEIDYKSLNIDNLIKEIESI